MGFRKMEVLLPIAQRTDDPDDIIISTPDWVSHAIVLFNTTNLNSDTPSVQPEMNLWMSGNGAFSTVAITASAIDPLNSVDIIGVNMGVGASTNTTTLEFSNMPIPNRWRIVLVHADAKPIDYGISIHWICQGGG